MALFAKDHMLGTIEASSQSDAFEALAAAAVRLGVATDQAAVVADYKERELEATTGFGGGIAIPHSKTDNVSGATLLFARLSQPVEWNSLDGAPVSSGSGTFGGPENWNTKYGDPSYIPDDWDAWISQIAQQVESDGETYEYPYDGSYTNYIPWEERADHATSVDKALYLTYTTYQELLSSGYNCYAVTAGTSSAATNPWGPSFMEYLAGGESFDIQQIQNDIYYLLDKGSTVVDVIGSGTYDDGTPYDFSFVDDASRLRLTVGEEGLTAQKMNDTQGATSAYSFGELRDGKYDYELYYYDGSDGSEERFEWKINVPVSNFAPVQLTYTVRLNGPRSDEGVYGTYDANGT